MFSSKINFDPLTCGLLAISVQHGSANLFSWDLDHKHETMSEFCTTSHTEHDMQKHSFGVLKLGRDVMEEEIFSDIFTTFSFRILSHQTHHLPLCGGASKDKSWHIDRWVCPSFSKTPHSDRQQYKMNWASRICGGGNFKGRDWSWGYRITTMFLS